MQQRGKNELLSVQDIAYFIGQGAEALQYVHENQIVHQDVKPSNFLLRSHDKHPQHPDLLLADFGIARLNTSTVSISHAIRGTPTYMAPEQWSGEPVYATDQYALAILAYELLAGHPPFAGRQEQVMFQHFHNQPLPPSTFNPQLSRDINEVILKALSKHPEERFISIAAFAAAFREAIADLDASTIIKVPARPHTNDFPLASPTLRPPFDQTVPLASSLVPTANEMRHSPSHNSQRGIPTGTAILLVGIALVLLFGGLGFYYLHSMNPSPSPTQTLTTNSTTQSTNANATTTANASNTATATATANALHSTPPVATTAPGTYVQLHHSYSGTASGYADGAITFTLNSEDLQGNVNMNTTFQQLTGAQKIAGYTCQGSVTLDRHLSLQCRNITDSTYVLTVQGYVYPDGHMEGTEIATNTSDPSYNHVYSWKVY